MEKMIVQGGRQLSGKVTVSGAKNAVLPVIAASILGENKQSTIQGVPALVDVYTIVEVLRNLNVKVKYDDGTLAIDATRELITKAPYEFVRRMRASVLVMGPLLARFGKASVALPGGCAIGSRPIDLHLKGLEALGANIHIGNGYVEATAQGRLQGNHIYLDIPSVGATENLMMAASLAEGKTIIEHAAEEPEIVDLARFLNAMGADIHGAGTDQIEINGVESLSGAQHEIMPDRIEAGTLMIAAAITRSQLHIEKACADHLFPLISIMKEMGVHIEENRKGITVDATDRHLQGADVKTMPYPGFPTDLQPQMMALLLSAEGSSVLTETVFENRFMHVEELKKMNAQIKIEGRSAIIKGGQPLKGAHVTATDLRAGASLILAGLYADGMTEIYDLEHIDRGYDNLLGKMTSIGADMIRVNAQGEEIVEEEIPYVKLKLSEPSFV